MFCGKNNILSKELLESHQELAGGTSFQWLLGVTTTLANRVKHLHGSDWCVIVCHVKDNTDNKEMSILAVRSDKTILTHAVNLIFTTHVSCAGCLGCSLGVNGLLVFGLKICEGIQRPNQHVIREILGQDMLQDVINECSSKEVWTIEGCNVILDFVVGDCRCAEWVIGKGRETEVPLGPLW